MFLLIDIGGTAIKYGLCSSEGVFSSRGEMKTEAKEHGGPSIVSKVRALVTDALSRDSALEGVAISTAGMVSPATGEIVYALPDALVEHLSDGICNVVTVVNPEAVILGGGIMARSDYLRPRLEKALQERLRPQVYEKTRLEFAALKNETGMLGALYNYLKRHS